MLAFLISAIRLGMTFLFGSTGETITEKSGHLNLGIPGVMYVGGISGVIGSFLYDDRKRGFKCFGNIFSAVGDYICVVFTAHKMELTVFAQVINRIVNLKAVCNTLIMKCVSKQITGDCLVDC